MKNADTIYKSKKYKDILNALHESIEKESDYQGAKNCIAASNADLVTWSYIKEIMKFECPERL